MASGMLRFVRRDGQYTAEAVGSAPLPWGVAVLLIAAVSAGLWLGIFKLLALLF